MALRSSSHLPGLCSIIHGSSLPFAGTYAGLVEKLGYLKRLGVNAIELLPVHEFNELEYYQVLSLQQPLPLVSAQHTLCILLATS